MIVVVHDWRTTFAIPADATHRFRVAPRWLVPAGVLVGFLLALVYVEWLPLGVNETWLLGAPVFLVCCVVMAMDVGGPRAATPSSRPAPARARTAG